MYQISFRFFFFVTLSCFELRADPVVMEWPVPPQQEVAWALPDGMNDPEGEIAKAVNELFEMGLPDPRGLPYHHVKVQEGDKTLKGRGWVLPTESDEVERFVMGWSGLLYPVVQVGEEADLKADLLILRKKGRFGEEPFDNYSDEILDNLIARFVGSARMMHPVAAPYLMLRLGEIVKVASLEEDPNPFLSSGEDDYGVELPRFDSEDDLIGFLFEYALHARSDGVAAFLGQDDKVAVERLRIFDRFFAEAMKRIPPARLPKDEEVDPFSNFDTIWIPEINTSWRELLEDAKRRLESAKLTTVTEVEKAIASWEDLEQWDENFPPESFRKVVASGPPAIGPLLKCMESDERWTRAVTPNESNRRVLRVRDLAISALQDILKFHFIDFPNRWGQPEAEKFEKVAAEAKAFCERYDDQCRGELWFRILEDQEADIWHQAMAAVAIVQPENAGVYYGITDQFFMADEVRDRFDDPQASMEGKLLRHRHDPSVLELMKKAWMREQNAVDLKLAAGEPESTHAGFVSGSFVILRSRAHILVRCMEEWQPGNLDVLKEHYDWLEEGILTAENDGFGSTFILSGLCEEVLIRRFWAEDKTAMADYTKLFRAFAKKGDLPIAVMKELPDTPGMDQLIAEAFLGKKAPLSFEEKAWNLYDQRERAIGDSGSLLSLPSLRKALVEGLRNQKVQGVFFEEEGVLMAKFSADKAEKAEGFHPNGRLRGKGLGGEVIEMRMCDLVADALTPRYGDEIWITPDFRLDDPVPKRDEMIADWIKLLEAER